MNHTVEKTVIIKIDIEDVRLLNEILREVVPGNTKFTTEECAALQELKDILSMYS